MTISEAYAHCTALAQAHYENFPVGLLVPARLAPHVHAVYAFARHADDLADEGYTDQQAPTISDRLAALQDWEQQLNDPNRGGINPIFIALHQTIREFELPLSLFSDLLSAFKQDVVKRRYENFSAVLDYCRRSANPVGRLVLLLHGHREDSQMQASDAICTALQLANFWQDVSVDLLKDRIYLPQDEMKQFDVEESTLFSKTVSPGFLKLLRFQVERTEALFQNGHSLMKTLPLPLRWEIHFTWHGGRTILRKIIRQRYDTLQSRPKLSKADFPSLLLRVMLGLDQPLKT